MDGRVARMLNAQSEQYDSLADMLAFGVAPPILIYSFALQPLGRIGIGCAFIYGLRAHSVLHASMFKSVKSIKILHRIG